MSCSTLSGIRYNQAQVRDLLAQAGWPANLIPTMSAIVMAESSGYSCAHNTCGENSVGLCQVYLTVHPDAGGQGRMCEPLANLGYCYQLYRQRQAQGRNGFTHWGAYTDGRYRAYLSGDNNVQPTVLNVPQLNAIASQNPQPSASLGVDQSAVIIILAGLGALLFFGNRYY